MPVLKLLIGCVATAVLGWETNTALSDLPDNTCLDLGSYSATCAARTGWSNCYGITDYGGFVYNPDRHVMLMMGGGHATTSRTDVDAFRFDSLDWRSDYLSTPCGEQIASNMHPYGHWVTTDHPYSVHTYDRLVYYPNVKKMIVLGNYKGTTPQSTANNSCITWSFIPGDSTRGHRYDCEVKTWAASRNYAVAGTVRGAGEYDPLSGRGVYIGTGGYCVYDPIEDTLFIRTSPRVSSNYGELVYFPPNDRFYYFSSVYNGTDTTKVEEISLDRINWTGTTARRILNPAGEAPQASTSSDAPETGYAYDSVNQIIGGAFRNNCFYSFDPLTSAWTKTAMNMSPAGSSFDRQNYHCVDYDPVDNVFIFLAGPYNNRRTWAYRYKASGTGTEPPAAGVKGPLDLSLSPNPFNRQAKINFDLAAAGRIRLSVFALDGKRVACLADGMRAQGSHSIDWNPGKAAPAAGVYLLRLETGRASVSRKVLINNH